MRRTLPLLAAVCLLPALASLFAAPPAPPAAPAASEDELLLQAAKIAVDGPGLLDYFRKHTTPPAQQERIEGLIRQLGDDAFKVREKASADLAALGPAAAPYLRRALSDPDEEVKVRAETLLKNAEGIDTRAAQSAAAARLIRQRAPDGAAEALLAYLPDADSDAVEDEAFTALAVLGVHDNKVDPVVVAAVKDKAPARRAAAGLVVGRSGTAEQRADVQALLLDPDPRVRFRAAQGLVAGRDRAGIPALVGLVKDGPSDLAFRADELLGCAAGYHGPHVPYMEDDANRQNCHKAWAAWEQKNGKTVDLAHADVDLPAFNPALRARDVVRQCFNSLVSGDLAAFKKSADAPFHMANEQTYQTRDDLARYFNEQPMGIRNQAFYPLVLGAVPLKEYMKTQDKGGNATPEEVNFALKFKQADLTVILVQSEQIGAPNPPDPTQGILFLVRLTGDQPRVVGISPGHNQIRYVW